jgi:8-oxo-dGTP pyrophosphatase MutT (NUDIX family)
MTGLWHRLRALLAGLVTRPPALQVAALCLREGPSGPEVLLVRSLDTGRWIIPKGWPMPGRTLAQAAATEAWEEAGVEGDIEPDACATYGYQKRQRGGLRLTCQVHVFRLRVARLADCFPEAGQRERRWFPTVKAAKKVSEPELRAYLAGLTAGAIVD